MAQEDRFVKCRHDAACKTIVKMCKRGDAPAKDCLDALTDGWFTIDDAREFINESEKELSEFERYKTTKE